MSARFFFLFAFTFLLSCHSTKNAQKEIHYPEEWVKDYKPFRIAGTLYYVGTDDLASYLITTPEGHILINTGTDQTVPQLKAHVAQLGFTFEDIKILLCTHAHFDHVGGMALVKKMTGAQLMVEEKDAPVLADGGKSDFLAGTGAIINFAPVAPDVILHDRDTIRLGGIKLAVLHHPGHTKGAVSYVMNVNDVNRTYKVLIANMPTILSQTKLQGMPTYPDAGKDYAYTLASLKSQPFDIFLSSHTSQFNLHKIHQPDDPYNPGAFTGHEWYNMMMDSLQRQYERRLKE